MRRAPQSETPNDGWTGAGHAWLPPERGRLLPLASFVSVLRAAVSAAPDRPDLRHRLARVLYRTHAFAEIIAWLEPFLAAADSDDAEALYYLGLSALAVDDRALAFRAFDASAKGGCPASFGYLAEVLTDGGRFDDALGAALEGLERQADDLKAFVVAARILLNRGEKPRLWALCKALNSRGAWAAFIPSAMVLAAETPDQRAEAGALMDRTLWCAEIDLGSDRPEFNQALACEVSAHPNLTPLPATKATVGDGERIDQFELVSGPRGLSLLAMIRREVERYGETRSSLEAHPMARGRPVAASLSAWSVITRRTGHESWHIHPDGWLSGVYYVEVPGTAAPVVGNGDEPPPGAIEFGPFAFRPSDARLPGKRWSVTPSTGKLLLFPSYLGHRTWPTGVDGNRIVVAFDVVPGNPSGSGSSRP